MSRLSSIVPGAKQKRKLREASGGAIALSTALAFALAILGIGFIALVLIMGAENETRNAVDSGVLNVGKQALDDIKVQSAGSLDPTSWAFATTSDTADASVMPDGNMSLRRINRLWGAALLIAINADAAQNDGQAGSAGSDAKQACDTAQQISDQLSDQLNKASNMYGYFRDYSSANSVRMMGLGTTTKEMPTGDWRTSNINHCESNLIVSGSPPNFNLPPNYTLDQSAYTPCTRTPMPSGEQNLYFLKGYTPISAANKTFWQTSFQYQMKPYLVSHSDFNQFTNQATQLDWSKPVPNAFSAQGTTTKSGTINETASSYVLTNPNQPFQLSLPHSFLRIHVDDPVSHWYFNATGWPLQWDPDIYPSKSYGYIPSFYTGPPALEGGILCSLTPDEVFLGGDVVGKTLDGIIFDYPVGSTASTEAYMVNRINEMIGQPGLSKSKNDLHKVLGDQKTIAMLPLSNDFIVYSPDGTNLVVYPQEVAGTVTNSLWLLPLISAKPCGTETELTNSTDAAFAVGVLVPIVEPDPACTPFAPPFGFGMYGKQIQWTPGSGANGCLGTVHVTRWTDIYSFGFCNPV